MEENVRSWPGLRSLMLTFVEDTHTYYLDGKEIPSVTSIIKGQGAGVDYSHIPEHILLNKARIGTLVHKKVEDFFLNGDGLDTHDRRAENYLLSFWEWYCENEFECLATERQLACSRFWFAGTVDLIGALNGKSCLIDLKTTATLHTDPVAIQLSAYDHLVKENDGVEVEERYALHLKEGEIAEAVPLGGRIEKAKFLKLAMAYNGK